MLKDKSTHLLLQKLQKWECVTCSDVVIARHNHILNSEWEWLWGFIRYVRIIHSETCCYTKLMFYGRPINTELLPSYRRWFFYIDMSQSVSFLFLWQFSSDYILLLITSCHVIPLMLWNIHETCSLYHLVVNSWSLTNLFFFLNKKDRKMHSRYRETRTKLGHPPSFMSENAKELLYLSLLLLRRCISHYIFFPFLIFCFFLCLFLTCLFLFLFFS